MFSVRAVVHSTPSAKIAIAGIPLLVRTVLTLWSAGIRVFTIVGAEIATREYAEHEIRRVAGDVRLHWVDGIAQDPEHRSLACVVITKAEGIFAAPAVTRLLMRNRLRNVRLAFGDRAGLWLLSPADHQSLVADADFSYALVRARAGDFCPVTGEADVERAERVLFRWSIKPTDGMVSRYFNRPLSTWISRRLSHYDIEPRQLTAVTALLALATFAALLTGTLGGLMLGCALYHVTSVVDGLDGEIARAKYMSTPRGAALDTGVDMASNLLFMIGISVGTAEVFGDDYLWMATFIGVTAAVSIATMASVLRLGPSGGSFDVLQLTIQQRLAAFPRLSRGFYYLNAVFKRDTFAFLFALMGLAGRPQVIIPWLLAFGVSTWFAAILVNTPAMLRANRDAVLPPHLKTAPALS